MFKKMDTRSARIRIESASLAKAAKPAKDAFQDGAINTSVTGMHPLNFAKPAKDPEANFSDFSKFSDGQSSNTHFPQPEADDVEWFMWLHEGIVSGGPYLRLWPQVRGYVSRQLPQDQYECLDEAYKLMQRRIVNDSIGYSTT